LFPEVRTPVSVSARVSIQNAEPILDQLEDRFRWRTSFELNLSLQMKLVGGVRGGVKRL